MRRSHVRRARAWAFSTLLALPLTLCIFPAAAAEVAVRVREDGRVDLRVKAAPLVSVLERLASQTGMKVTYQGPPPRRTVSLEVSAANQAEAVLEVLEGMGADYAVTTDSAGTRILSLVVAGAGAETSPASVEPASPSLPDSSSPPDAIGPDAPATGGLPGSTLDAKPEDSASAGSGDTYAPLAGDFVPGGRATGQPTEWGAPPFVLPDLPDIAAPADASSSQPPEEPNESAPPAVPQPAATPETAPPPSR